MPIGKTIKKFRQEKGLTQEELGELLGVQKAAVQKYESGQVQNLKQSTVKRLCEVFGKEPGVFIFDDTEAHLRVEVELLETIQRTYGEEVINLVRVFLALDGTARAKVMDYASDLEALQSLREQKPLN